MAVDHALKLRFTQTINVARLTATSAARVETFATATAVKAHVVERRRLHPQANGTQLVTSHDVATETQILITDAIWLPDDASADPSTTPPNVLLRKRPLYVGRAVNENGTTSHYRASL